MTSLHPLICSIPPISSIEAYKRYVKSIPVLSEPEEEKLAEKVIYENCIKSAQKLILSQLKTVLFIAKQYSGYGLPEEDLIQEGNIGLMKAVKNYNIKHKVRLYSYAVIWIKSEIQSYIIKNWKIVKIATTKNLKKLFFNFKSNQKTLMDYGIDKKDLIKSLAKKLDVSEKDVQEMQSYLLQDDSFINDENNKETLLIQDKETPETIYIQNHDNSFYEKKISDAINTLNERQKQVIEFRFFTNPKKTHKEISDILNISSERVRQIEQQALLKIKEKIPCF